MNPEFLLKLFPRVESIELSAGVRIDLYLIAINEITRNFLFGKGLYTMAYIIEDYGLKYQIHAHNLILEVFLSSGLVGFILLTWHFIVPLFKPIEEWIKKDHPYIPLVIGICALEIGNGFTDAVIVFPQTFILISLVFFSLEVKHENH
jgi:O-antigen ligase